MPCDTQGTCPLRPSNSAAIRRLRAGNLICARAPLAPLRAPDATLWGEALVTAEQLEDALAIDQINKS